SGLASGATRDRQRAVARPVGLAQAAWFIARRHVEEVAAGNDPSGLRLAEGEVGSDTTRETVCQRLVLLFQSTITLTDDGDPAATGDNVLGRRQGQIDAFLVNQA